MVADNPIQNPHMPTTTLRTFTPYPLSNLLLCCYNGKSGAEQQIFKSAVGAFFTTSAFQFDKKQYNDNYSKLRGKASKGG